MKMQESGENYLEAIFILKNEKGAVRSIDVAHKLDFSKPSVSRAVSLLKKDNYISVNQDGFIELTDSGKEVAQQIYERHTILTDFLTSLGVPLEIALQDACKIEHDVSRESFEKIKQHTLHMKNLKDIR